MVSLLLPLIYLAFISLGLPDSLLGAAWPVLHAELDVPLSWSGYIFIIISLGTVVSSLLSDRLSRRLGAGGLTALSVGMTCGALFGFSLNRSFAALCLCAIPYGLGAGGVDAALNNYVALHYKSRHMSWLHCMWGVGAAIGPYIMSAALSGAGWSVGYRSIGFIQLGLSAVLLLSLPLWKRAEGGAAGPERGRPLSLREIAALPGAKAAMSCCFCYCAGEQTVLLWASSYLVNARGLDAVTAARYASLFFLGITAGRAASGFLTLRLNDRQMARVGFALEALGIALLDLPLGNTVALIGLLTYGLGCAPIYPSLLHATPDNFGATRSQAIIGVQMASAYVGTTLMPPLFGAIAAGTTIRLMPLYLLLLLSLMLTAHTVLCRKTKKL